MTSRIQITARTGWRIFRMSTPRSVVRGISAFIAYAFLGGNHRLPTDIAGQVGAAVPRAAAWLLQVSHHHPARDGASVQHPHTDGKYHALGSLYVLIYASAVPTHGYNRRTRHGDGA